MDKHTRWATSTDDGDRIEQPSPNAAYDQARADWYAGATETRIWLDEGSGWVLYTAVDHAYHNH